MLSLFLMILGFALLIGGAHFLVDGASAVARRLKLSELMIGLTVVAFGTSAPELVVSVLAAAKGNTAIAVGNVLGSNTANVLLILAVAALIRPLAVGAGTVWKEIPLSVLAAILVAVLGNDQLINGEGRSVLARTDGLALLAFFVLFLYYVAGIARDTAAAEGPAVKGPTTLTIACLTILGGLVGLNLGAELVVRSATTLARVWGISEMTIGVTIVAVGTSLPELATSAVAAWKGNVDLAVGNVVGSNVFNVFFILGVSATIAPLPLHPSDNFDVGMTVLASLLLFVFMLTGRPRNVMERWEAVLCLLLYAGYLTFLAVYRR